MWQVLVNYNGIYIQVYDIYVRAQQVLQDACHTYLEEKHLMLETDVAAVGADYQIRMLTLREKKIELYVHEIKLYEHEFVLCKHELVLGQQAAKEDWLLFFLSLFFFFGDAQGQCYDNC
jgi:hypothetical protein